ncbi:hypothetical protein EDC39_101170 [Geothermobacter ehrlichii]|uniref:Uncharacterized protein n=1 Tax=Geothermobacter ehrlichii TaxID=213224 RepID=A0A5D3WQC8_9BACT|nr:hypothetical protein [Geothermobacter ehrlichii]TYP00010.1 hypothetical protein EDC39_101170 [Geothermobacter ehrlichii]
MIWLDLMTEGGQGLYFEAWKRERQRTGSGGELVSGLIGDGSYEGEVLVELADDGCDLTFVDSFLAPADLRAFLSRVSVEELKAALRESLAGSIDDSPLASSRRRRDDATRFFLAAPAAERGRFGRRCVA